MTYIKNDITFTELPSDPNNTQTPIENQSFKIHLTKHKQLNINNLYIPPRDTTSPHHETENLNIENCLNPLLNTPNTLITGDFNAHSALWHSSLKDKRGKKIADLIQNSIHLPLNMDTHTRIPPTINQQSHLLTSLLSPMISTLTPNGKQSTHSHQTTYRSSSQSTPNQNSDSTKTK